MRNKRSKLAALLAVSLLAGQAGTALAAESETQTKQQSASTTQPVSVSVPKSPTPEDMQKNLQAMAPMMGTMMTMMLESMAKKLAEPQMAEYYATFMRNYYLALVKQGFTEDQALKIVSSTGLPSTGQQK